MPARVSLLVRVPASTLAAPGPGPGAWPVGPSPRVGHYRILGRIAEGGMGAVYEAEQDNPRRHVALKVIRPGRASPALLRRFRHGAQILGRLHHPGTCSPAERSSGTPAISSMMK
jgi:serine/threonine protein kinase